MGIDEIEAKIREIRGRPLKVICVMPTGRICTATVRQCAESKARYVRIIADELDELLGAALGGDNEQI